MKQVQSISIHVGNEGLRSAGKRFAWRAMTSAIALTIAVAGGGCSAPPSAMTMACYAQCDAKAKATGCTSMSLSDSDCRTLCDAVIKELPSNCNAAATASWSCGATAQWSCNSSNVLSESNGCAAQDQAFSSCFTVDDGGT